MAAVAFGLFLLVLQTLGAFSIFQSVGLHERLNSWEHPKPWNYRSFKDVERFYLDRFHRMPIVDRNFNYEIFPSITFNNEKDSTVERSQRTSVKSADPSSIITLPSWDKSIDIHRKPVVLYRRKNYLRSKSIPENSGTTPKPNILHPSMLEKLIRHVEESQNEISLILDTEKADFKKENISTSTSDISHNETVTNGITSEGKETGKNAEAEKKANITSVEEDGKTDTTSTKNLNNITAVDDKGNENATVEVENKNEKEEVTITNDITNNITAVEEQEKTSTSATDETAETTIVDEDMIKNITDIKYDNETTAADETRLTGSPLIITSDENSTGIINETSADNITSAVTQSTTIPSGETQSTTIKSSSTAFSDGSTKSSQPSSTHIEPEVSSGDSVTESVHIIPEHVINIRTIKTAKIVLATLLLVTCLIAVAVLAACVFKVKRREVQYDQLTLLPAS